MPGNSGHEKVPALKGTDHNSMTSLNEVTTERGPLAELGSGREKSAQLVEMIVEWLDDGKAEGIVTIDLSGKSSIGDFMIIASGRTDRHVGALADQVATRLKDSGHGKARVEGTDTCDWVLIDTGDIIVHVFRPEVREFYNLEKMWASDRPEDGSTH